MNKTELRKKELEELNEMRQKLEDEISEEYFSVRTGKGTNVRKPRLMRKELAVINTVIAEKNRAKLKEDAEDE